MTSTYGIWYAASADRSSPVGATLWARGPAAIWARRIVFVVNRRAASQGAAGVSPEPAAVCLRLDSDGTVARSRDGAPRSRMEIVLNMRVATL